MRSTIMGAASHVNAGLKGTLDLGFWGVIPGSDFIQPQALSTLANMDGIGSLSVSSVDWLKFAYQQKTLMIPMRSLRHNLTHAQLRARNVVNGSKTVNIGGHEYKVRLINGITGSPSAFPVGDSTNHAATINTEFSRLFYRVAANGGFTGDDQWANFTDAQLGFTTANPNGRAMIVAEYQNDDQFILRGAIALKHAHKGTYGGSLPARGWRPVLELVNEP